MRIAVDYQSVFGSPTGIGVFARGLIEEARRSYPGIEWLLYAPKARHDLNTPERIIWESASIPVQSFLDKADLVYSPGFAPAILPVKRAVVTVHDIIGVFFQGNQAAVSSFYWRHWLPAALKRSTKLVASSASTQRDLERRLGIPGEHIPIVPLFAHARFQKLSNNSTIKQVLEYYSLDRPFFICTGTLEPRKNLIRLLEAYEIVKRRGRPEFGVAIVGKGAAGEGTVRRYVMEKGLSSDIRLLGYVPDDDLVALYNGSLGFVNVSLYEGFGLPALEAMCCGKSGVCSDRTSLPEVVGDSALSVDPMNVNEIALAMDTFFSDTQLRDELSKKAHARSSLFSSDKTVNSMVRIFKEVVR